MALAIELVWIKALHALSCLSSVAWGRYQVVYLNSLGLSPSRIGVLRAAGLAAKFFTIPLWGAWQDVSPTSVAPALASVASCAALLGLYRRPFVTGTFSRLLVLKVARSGANGLGTLVDALTLRVVERHGGGYGAQRLWTGVAWGLGSYFVGVVIDARGYDAIFTWTYGFAALVVVLLVLRPGTAGAGGVAAAASPEAPRETRAAVEGNLRRYVAHARSRSDLRVFFAVMLLYGVAMSLVEALLFLQMARDFGSSKALMGSVTLVGTCTEYPLFLKSESLLRRYGPASMIAVAHGAMAARLLGLSLVGPESASWALPTLQLLHGPCFALAWTGAVRYAADAAPAPLRATSMSFLSSTYYVLGAGVGSVLWSCVYEAVGAPRTYVIGAALVLSSTVLLVPKLASNRSALPVALAPAAWVKSAET